MKFTVLKEEGRARRAVFETVHGTVQTPAFMNVATVAAIKGGLSTVDLKEVGAQVMLCNTYHLHVRPGDRTTSGDTIIRQLGGLHKFTNWDRPISQSLTKFKKMELHLTLISTAEKFLWVPKRVCKFNRI